MMENVIVVCRSMGACFRGARGDLKDSTKLGLQRLIANSRSLPF
ncbi:hypothetical protein Hdeb2414_s0006g00195191 [Helianthus debilis subsp. tardiflorus]